MSARQRLCQLAAAAGYPTDVLGLIAQATLPRYEAGERLDDQQVQEVAEAVCALAQAGHRADTLPAIAAHYQRRFGARWREFFWASALRLADTRYRHPELYGLSPCEQDPERLAGHPAAGA